MSSQLIVLAILIGLATMVEAQPGDGLPDLYYDSTTGIVSIDSDTNEFIALFINTPSSESFSSIFTPPTGSIWTGGEIMPGSWQFVQTSPLSGPGALGKFDLLLGPSGLLPSDLPSPGGSLSNVGPATFVLEYTKVPEPNSAVLLLLVAVPFAVWRRRPRIV